MTRGINIKILNNSNMPKLMTKKPSVLNVRMDGRTYPNYRKALLKNYVSLENVANT